MLIEFKVGNFRSFKEIHVLRMSQVLDNDGRDGTLFDDPSKMMLIYGSNGSGKSNLVKAMEFSRDIALYGTSRVEISRYHGHKGPSYFEYVIQLDNTVYSYGFELKPENVSLKSEWLYILNPDEDVCLYEYESTDNEDSNSRSKRLYCQTKMNTLSKYDDNYDYFLKVRNWLDKSVIIEDSRMKDEIIMVSKDIVEMLKSGLSQLDTGIADIVEKPFTNTEIPRNLVKRISVGTIDSDGDYIVMVNGNDSKRGWLIHAICQNGMTEYRNITFKHECGYESNLNNQSLGTLRIIQLLALFSILQDSKYDSVERLIVLDEIECSVHTIIVDRIIRMFESLNSNRGQLISTTHKTYLLRNDDLEDDHFSFIDLDRTRNDGSLLYTMTSFDHIMKDRHRAYMDGRMAAIPLFTNFR